MVQTPLGVPNAHSESTTSSSESLSQPIQQPLSRNVTDGLATANVGSANAFRRNELGNETAGKPRRSAVDKAVLRSVNMLAGMWHHTWKARK
jgi:hypothetical protein